MLKATTHTKTRQPSKLAVPIFGQIQSSLQIVSRWTHQVRAHEELLRAAGVRIDRAGAALLFKLRLNADSRFRVTSLATLLGVDAPTVTRKVQQLERLGYVAREPDPDDGRASLIRLTSSGESTVERILAAGQDRLARLFEGWDNDDVRTFGVLLARFAETLSKDTEPIDGN